MHKSISKGNFEVVERDQDLQQVVELKLEFFIKCRIKFILIYLQFICNINQQRTDNKIKIFYTKKINILCSHFQQINQNMRIVICELILIFNFNWIFHNILNNYHFLISVIIHNQLNLPFFDLFIKFLASGIFNLQFNNLLQVLIFFNHFKIFFRNRL